MIRVALDVMGGDLGAEASIDGLNFYVATHGVDDVFFDLFGNQEDIEKLLLKYPLIKNNFYSIHNTSTNVIESDMKPSLALKKGRGTSMFEAVLHVANKKADAVVSSGNTGAYMSLARVLLKMIDGIDRPAIVSLVPTVAEKCVMLDLGANSECSAKNLMQFAIMGVAAANILLRIEKPTVGLLNIGTEKGKGGLILNEAFDLLENCNNINFVGFIEGSDISKSKANVVVTDGFSGNVALKTMEGTMRYLVHLLKNEAKNSFCAKIFFLFCRKMFRNIKKTIDPRHYNGASLIGLSAVAVKSHGGSDGVGFANAILVAVDLAKSNFVENIKNEMSLLASNGVNDDKNI